MLINSNVIFNYLLFSIGCSSRFINIVLSYDYFILNYIHSYYVLSLFIIIIILHTYYIYTYIFITVVYSLLRW